MNELWAKNNISVMAALICIQHKNAKYYRVLSCEFFISTLQRYKNSKKLPGTIFPDYLSLCIILLKFYCLFAQFWYTANKGLIWHLSALFRYHISSFINFRQFWTKWYQLFCIVIPPCMMKKSARICCTMTSQFISV